MKTLLTIFFFGLILFMFTDRVYAALDCSIPANQNTIECKFGTIAPPPAISTFIGSDPTGAGGISKFLSNLIALIYTIATIVLIFMLLWGAFDWITSGGDKEKIQEARGRITNAIIGIVLFSLAFAAIAVLGEFTGFKFFEGQGIQTFRDSNGIVNKVTCANGKTFFGYNIDPIAICK